jgi:hypothetical protein
LSGRSLARILRAREDQVNESTGDGENLGGEDTLRDIEVNQRLRKNLHPKTARYEFNRGLHKYISHKFPKMKEADKAALIGAVKASARLFPAAKLLDDHVDSVQREMTRAKQHEKKQHHQKEAKGRKINKHEGRLQPKKKQEPATNHRRKKKQKGRSSGQK